jgi:CheY-like chemotaxis protein
LGLLNVKTVADGKQAVDAVKKASDDKEMFDVILMDLHMPEMDGITATKHIRELQCGKSVYIVALTADVQTSVRTQCLDAGMNDFLGKPFKQKDMLSVLTRACENVNKV